MFYKEDEHGQILEEGITEAGSISSFIAAGTSYSAHGVQMVPFYIYYSMFGYQRVGDLVWAGGDSRTRGFLLGGTAGRTTLNGEGLQHADGHSHVLFSVVPNVRAYDPAFGYEVAVIVQDGLRRMVAEQEDVFFYLTLMNENYKHPAMPEGAEEGILRGMYLLREGSADGPRVQLLGSGTILLEVLAAASLLEEDWGVSADVWSVTSFTELRRDGIEAERWSMLHPTSDPRRAYVAEQLGAREGPVVASTDWIRAYPDQIRQWVPGRYRVLGTDGYGRSDFRRALRRFFEVDRHYVDGRGPVGARRRGDRRPAARTGRDRALRDRPRGPDPDDRMSTAEAIPVEVPDIGDFEDIPVIEIHVSEGDRVAADDPLLTLESDKATMDVPAPFSRSCAGGSRRRRRPGVAGDPARDDRADGRRGRLGAGRADRIRGRAERGERTGRDRERARGRGSRARFRGRLRAAPAVASASNGGEPVYASPSVRRRARELGIDLHSVKGTGRKGRITVEDLERGPAPAAAGPAGASLPGLAPWPSLDFSKQGPVERVPRSRIQKISAPNLARNWALIPHVTHNDEADITELEAWRKQLNSEHASDGVKVTMVSFLVVACVATLKEFPDFNSSLDGDELIVKRYYNVGFAADTPGGLVVPVIKGADEKGLLEIARELAELSAKARDGKLGLDEITGSTFTISSLGGIGGTSFTPIVNAPEVAILGVTRSAMKPVWDGQQFQPRLMLPLSLSYDHRVIDGAAAARFVVHLAGVLSDLRRALL